MRKIIAVAMGAILALSMSGCTSTKSAEKEAAPASAPTLAAARSDAVDIRRPPTDLPAAITRKRPDRVVVHLETTEVVGKVQEGVTYTYWTFNDKVPGPMIRARVGDTIELHLKNNANSLNTHSIDLHAVNGPGGGAVSTQVKPGEEKVFSFKALNPGTFIYHCASPSIPAHIAEGMYGLIVIEPEEGLPTVDHEFYVMQGELYTTGQPGQKGHHEYNGDLMKDEHPTFVVFNGAYQALTGDMAMKVKVGDTVRLFVGNGGPNQISSFHVIGEIFDRVHQEGASESASNVQTTLIPAGGATQVEFKVNTPGNYTMVDHAIERAIFKGALGVIQAEGSDNPDVYNGKVEPGSGH